MKVIFKTFSTQNCTLVTFQIGLLIIKKDKKQLFI